MLMQNKRRGLFGAQPPFGTQEMPLPGTQSPYGDMEAGGLPPIQQHAPEKPKRKGFLGANTAEKIYAIGGALRDNDGGQAIGQYFAMLNAQKQAEAQARAKAEQAQMERQQGWQDWVRKEEYKRENPMPVNNDTVNDVNWFLNASPEEKAAYREMNPEYRQGPDGRFYRIDAGGGMAPPTRPVGKLTPIGGPSQPAAGGFRR